MNRVFGKMDQAYIVNDIPQRVDPEQKDIAIRVVTSFSSRCSNEVLEIVHSIHTKGTKLSLLSWEIYNPSCL